MNKISYCLVFGLALSLAGCGTQYGSDYQGESLGTVQGKVLLGSNVRTDDLEAAVINYNFLVSEKDPSFSTVTGAPVEGTFPAEFHLELLAPPPEAALNDYTLGGKRPDESRFSVGYLAVLHRGVSVDDDPDNAIAGLASDYVLVYADRDVKAGTDSARYLGGTPSKGYHLMRYVPMTDAERIALEAQCDLSAPPDQVSFPNPQVCGPGDATDKLVANPDEFMSSVTVQLQPPGATIEGGNIF